MFFNFNTDSAKRFEIQVLNIVGRRLQQDLKLIVMLETVGVFTITAVGGSATRLHIGSLPRSGAKTAQCSGGVKRTGTNFVVVRLHDYTTQICPIALKAQDHILKRQHLSGVSIRLAYFVVSHNAPYR